jgi:hypothetical protein
MHTSGVLHASVLSEVVRVYTPKSFPGMKESTPLTRCFARQGVKVPLRKETRVIKGKNANNNLLDEKVDADDDGLHATNASP